MATSGFSGGKSAARIDIVSCVIILAWSEVLDHKSYQTITFILVSVVTIFSKFYVDKILAKKSDY